MGRVDSNQAPPLNGLPVCWTPGMPGINLMQVLQLPLFISTTHIKHGPSTRKNTHSFAIQEDYHNNFMYESLM